MVGFNGPKTFRDGRDEGFANFSLINPFKKLPQKNFLSNFLTMPFGSPILNFTVFVFVLPNEEK
jgi:hypothetical protein